MLFLDIFLKLHVFAGGLAAFIAFPVAVLSPKGTRLHYWSGMGFVACFLFICGGGYLLELDNLRGAVVEIFKLEAASPFGKRSEVDHLAFFNSAMLNTLALYVAVSGWRVWKRSAAAKANQFPKFDTWFAVTYLLAGLAFAICFWFTLNHRTGTAHLSHLQLEIADIAIIAAAMYVAFDSSVDIYISVAKRAPKRWWLIHARKMISAELGLLAAFPYRCSDPAAKGGFFVFAAAVLVAGLVAARMFHKKQSRQGDL